MRIAYLCADRGIPVWGTKGASIHVRSVAQSLSERGHQVDVLAMRAGEEPPTGFEPRTFEVPESRATQNQLPVLWLIDEVSFITTVAVPL